MPGVGAGRGRYARAVAGPDVTVSIVHASDPALTLACLESLHAESDRRRQLEIVVLDNAAEDAVAAAIRERFPDVRVVEQAWRAGFGANHNAVVRSTTGRYVFVLNPDTEVGAGTIDGLAEYLDAHPDVAIVGPLVRGFDGERQFSAVRFMSVPRQLAWAVTLGRVGADAGGSATEPKHVDAVSGCAMLVRRDAFAAVGMFDERYFMYAEETDLARRLAAQGWTVHYVPTVEVFHHRLQSTEQHPERRVNEFWRSFGVYVSLHHSAAEARLLRWVTGFGYALAFVAASLGRHLPQRLRPAGTASWDPSLYRLHVRCAFAGVRGPTFRDHAAEWNRAHHVAAPEPVSR